MAGRLVWRFLQGDINEWLRARFAPSSYGAAWLLCAQAYFFFSYSAVYTLHLPRVLLYGNDALNCFVFILALYERKKLSRSTHMVIGLMALYCFTSAIGGIISSERLTILLWGYRNIVRYFMFFYSCVVLLKKNDFGIIIRSIRVIFWASVPLCTVERFLVTYSEETIIGDMIGGFFWNFSGSNLPLNLILCLYLIDVCSRYFNRNAGVGLFAAAAIAAIYMAATAELKVFLVELVVIVIFTAFGKGVSWRTVLALLVGGVMLSTASMYFIALNAGKSTTYADNYSLQGYLDYATRDTGYNGTGDLNRFTGIGTVGHNIFHDDPLSMLFGIGLGNADYTNFFVSDFYTRYSYLNYQWFHAIWMFIETGYVGIVLYMLIIVVVFLKARKKDIDDQYGVLVQATCIIMIVLFFYNITLRLEPSAYLLMLIMSIPYVMEENSGKKTVRRNI
ncbi:3-phosphoshikimate 1-carboxyvinyltransferase [Bifidobacterium callimiconis]|uniref:EpsP n=1 Tax=Bifidobacterium callimiconis TaxID=2306973 RepID=A0A430FBJ0_9BIFI|nr:3-phosphoshikimate 1-carboxyvinyltransferase [Bifidobacterium callimiconis]RSX50199.1 EpsP [Bifidobacterium callimiconis]